MKAATGAAAEEAGAEAAGLAAAAAAAAGTSPEVGQLPLPSAAGG